MDPSIGHKAPDGEGGAEIAASGFRSKARVTREPPARVVAPTALVMVSAALWPLQVLSSTP